jgi:hypothetical protein
VADDLAVEIDVGLSDDSDVRELRGQGGHSAPSFALRERAASLDARSACPMGVARSRLDER